jgi:hypothetical protein
MDWIERWFGISPDGGDGSTELTFLLVGGAAVAVLFAACSPSIRAALRRLFASVFH